MAKKKGQVFKKHYQTLGGLKRALSHYRSQGYTLTNEGKVAEDLLRVMGVGFITMSTGAAAGAKIGGLVGGPKGVPIGAGVGAIVGLSATMYAVRLYVHLVKHRDGTFTATYRPA